MMKSILIVAAIILSNVIYGQTNAINNDTVFAFFEYKLKNAIGIEDAFNAGYEKDLEWHKSQNDKWSWAEMSNQEWGKYSQAVITNESELWSYKPKLSLYPGGN